MRLLARSKAQPHDPVDELATREAFNCSTKHNKDVCVLLVQLQ